MESNLAYNAIEKEYDDVPYPSYPFPQSHPSHAFTLATLFGLHPAPIEKANVLELGCAAGGNLIPIAIQMPEATFLGIDLSAKQVNEGLKKIQDLELKNVEIRHQSILDFNSDKKFDYIICHGVFSWVDDAVKDKILEICERNLNPQGTAYISYNTLPGWNMVITVRDLMLWHTQNVKEPSEKAKQARGVLKFITDGLQNDKSSYAGFLQSEIDLLSKQADSYMLHEHLSLYNTPMYFYQFMERANQHKLSYLCDTYLSTMYSDNLPPQFSKELVKVQNVIAAGQYMDFIRNQRFRCTLLCHNNQTVNRALNTKDIQKFYLQLSAEPENGKLTEEDIKSEQEMVFTGSGMTFRVRNTISKQAMFILWELRDRMIHFNELCELVAKKVDVKDMNVIRNNLTDELNLMRAVLAGLINISALPPKYISTVSPKPVVCPYIRYQAKLQDFVTNRRHQTISIDPLGKILLPLLDGTYDEQSCIQAVKAELDAGKINLLDDKQQIISDKAEVEKRVGPVTKEALKNYARQAFLIA